MNSPSLFYRSVIRHAGVCATVTGFIALGVPPGHGGAAPDQGESAPPADRSRFTLLHPTPDDLLRSFNSDRPSQCTGARTVDAGHFYLEGGLFDYRLDLGLAREDRWSLAQLTLRAGLTNSLELELIFDGAQNQRTREVRQPGGGRTTETITGTGPLTVRLRQNLFGNDRGKVAFAVVPQLIVPTSTVGLGSSRGVQGSVVLPLSINLPGDFDLTVHNEFGALRNDADTRYEFNSVQGLSLQHDLLKDKVSAYVEWFSTATVGPESTYAEQLDVGLLWQAGKNLQLDAGCNFGVSRDAPDFQPFAGVVARF